MDLYSQGLRAALKEQGVTEQWLATAWPRWWSEEAETSLTAQAQLRLSMAQKLGMRASDLLEDNPVFVWQGAAKYKNLGNLAQEEIATLTSFGVALGTLLSNRVEGDLNPLLDLDPLKLRGRCLTPRGIGLQQVLALTWSLGIPVVAARQTPISKKGMYAMCTSRRGRAAVLLMRESNFPAEVAFWIAHELGHLALGHLDDCPIFLDAEDPSIRSADPEEMAADRFAMQLLTGGANLNFEVEESNLNARALAYSALENQTRYQIDAGTIVLSYAHESGKWALSRGAMKILGAEASLMNEVNKLAGKKLNLKDDSEMDQYLRGVLGVAKS